MSDIQLPSGWEKRESQSGKTFYKNTVTGQTQWDTPAKPADDGLVLPADWAKRTAPDGRVFYKNTVTGKTQWDLPTAQISGAGDKNLLPNWVEKKSSTTGKIYYYNTKTGKTLWKLPEEETGIHLDCANVRGLKWVGMSCYLDSTLVSLFAVPTTFVDNIINMELTPFPPSENGLWPCGKDAAEDLRNRQLVQKQLRIIANSIRGEGDFVDYCFDLRETFKKCPDPERYYDTAMKDAGEFLGYILAMFPVNTAERRVITYGSNDRNKVISEDALVQTSNLVDNRASVVRWVDTFQLLAQKNKSKKLSSFISFDEDNYPSFFKASEGNLFRPSGGPAAGQKFIRRISTDILERAPYIVFSLKRISSFAPFIKASVIPDEEITLSSEQKFALSAIVLFQGAHYTCTFRCGEEWYYYNDMGGDGSKYEIRKVGTYEKMLRDVRPNPVTNGTQYYYTPL